MVHFWQIIEYVKRKKTVSEDLYSTGLNRCLTLLDLTLFGVGNMAGSGIYVLTGGVSRNVAGPGIIFSYIFAGLAALLSAMCYSEFGAKLPKAGASYSYVYVVMGELAGFMVGWNMVLEFTLSLTVVAKATSGIVDTIFNGTMSGFICEHVGTFNQPWMAQYLDLVALAIVFIIVIIVSAGVRITGFFNNIITFVNLTILLLICGLGVYFADKANWINVSHGGFLPFGVSGVVAGSSSCFFAYLGFEAIAVMGEEAINPTRNLPLATLLSIFIATVFYVATSASLTLMVPYYEVSVLAPFTEALRKHQNTWGTILVSIGSLFGLISSMVVALYANSRLLYALSMDGLIFKFLSNVNATTRTPINSILITGLISAILALFLNIEFLIELLSIGVLFAFTMLAISLIILRYQTAEKCPFKLKDDTPSNNVNDSNSEDLLENVQDLEDIGKLKKCFKNVPLIRSVPVDRVVPTSLFLIIVFFCSFVIVIKYSPMTSWWGILLVVILLLLIIASILLLCTLEKNISFEQFQVPMIPLVPVLCICINIFLMFSLNKWTWVRLAVWVALGLLLYFSYGIRNSSENEHLLNKVPPNNYSKDEKNGEEKEE